jgi:soluble lytic murein transglycosylase
MDCLARIIPALFRSASLLSIVLGLSSVTLYAAEPLESLATSYRKNPTTIGRSALEKFAAAHPKDTEGAQALLALGTVDYERAAFPQAIVNLRAAGKRLPRVRDYIAYLTAAAAFGAQNYPDAVTELEGVWNNSPPSPAVPKAVLLAAHSFLEMKRPKDAIDLLRKHLTEVPAPQGDFLLAKCFEALGDAVSAATYYQNVYYLQPASPEAAQSEAALAKLRQTLGDNYPPAMPQTMLTRAFRLLNAGETARAKHELESLVPQLGGTDRDLARVRVGVASYLAKDNQAAYRYLRELTVSSAEADAERLYYLHAIARRLDKEEEAADYLKQLEKYSASAWRLQALLAAGNHFLVKNDPGQYEPLFRTCYEAFPSDSQAPYCHWKVAWNAYLHRRSDALELLKAHLLNYPHSEKAAAALYFLGRSAEKTKADSAAKAYYAELADRFPNFFHAVLARERLMDPGIAHAKPSPETEAFLKSVPFPARAPKQIFDSNAATRMRIERARLLSGAALDDWAETELRFGAKTDAQPALVAIELAQLAEKRGSPDQGIRYIKSLASGYLSMPLDAAPDKFWRLAFPLPYRGALEANSKAQSLDPYLVAALIRQESEFNPQAVSRAKAYGLTQVLPSTGRELSRKLGVRRFTAGMLFEPDLNLKLGTYYFRSLLDQFGGKVEPALASYNGGKTRVLNWLNFAVYEEPAEFVENIPFTETRNYVQIILRNADIYRRLYAPKTTAVISTNGHSSERTGGADDRNRTPAVP